MLSLLLVGALALGAAAGPSIGLMTARGSFQVDRSTVSGNATLFDGTLVETAVADAELQLNSGARLALGAGTKGKVYADRLALEQGQGEVGNTARYTLDAMGLKVRPESAASTARVAVADGSLRVAALGGPVIVINRQGMLLARVMPGTALRLEPGAAKEQTMTLSGTLRKSQGRFLLTDGTANLTVELSGAGMESFKDKPVRVIGTVDPAARPGAGGYQIVKVTSISVRVPGSGGAASAAAVGMSVKAKVLIAGVAIAGAGAATHVALTRGEEESVPVSR